MPQVHRYTLRAATRLIREEKLMATYYGMTLPTPSSQWEDVYYLYDADGGMEYWLMSGDHGRWAMGACHEDVGLVHYWTGERDDLAELIGTPVNHWLDTRDTR